MPKKSGHERSCRKSRASHYLDGSAPRSYGHNKYAGQDSFLPTGTSAPGRLSGSCNPVSRKENGF